MDPLAQLECLVLPRLTPSLQASYANYFSLQTAKAMGFPATFEQTPEEEAQGRQLNDLLGILQDALTAARQLMTDSKQPLELRERATRAYFRAVAWDALLGNELTEYQKVWPLKKAKQLVGAWIASDDPHAKLAAELQARELPVIETVEAICRGWSLRTPDNEEDYEPSPKVVRKKLIALAGQPGIVDAVRAWLPTLDADDYARKVLHAGAVLAADGSKLSAKTLAPILEEAASWSDPARFEDVRPRPWVIAVWSKLAPKGSVVASLLS